MDSWMDVNYPFAVTESLQKLQFFGGGHFERIWDGTPTSGRRMMIFAIFVDYSPIAVTCECYRETKVQVGRVA